MNDATTIILVSVIGVSGVVLLLLILQISKLQKTVKQMPRPSASNGALSATDKQQIEADLRQKADLQVMNSVKDIDKELQDFVKQLKNTLLSQATTTLTGQLDQSKQLMAETVENLNRNLSTAGAEATSQLQSDINQHKTKLVEQFEEHMASVVSNYLISALGAESAETDQASQAIKQLEAHKDEIRKDLLHEA